MSDTVFKSIGPHGMWGFSAGFDFEEAIINNNKKKIGKVIEDTPLNILLLHPGDIRHILMTIARRRRHHKNSSLRPINFYIIEQQIEVLARNILLMEVLTDFEVPIRQRANIFLEIFGNCKVQDRTNRYIEQLGHLLRCLVNNGTGKLEDIIDLSLLRYRERDELELTFKTYSRQQPFDIDSLFEHRCRGLFAERYDSRVALTDFDWHRGIKDFASIIHIKQYKEFRKSGIAFEFGDQEYTYPNRTMMSYTEGTIKAGKDKGLKKEIKGYWNDIVCSPYMAFGIDCDTPNLLTEGLFEIWNKGTGTEQHRHHTVEVALFNMFSTLWEIETGQIYQITKKNDIYSGLGAEQSSFKKVDTELSEEQLAEKDILEELCGINDNNTEENINDIEELNIDDNKNEKKSKDFISKGFLDGKSNNSKDIVIPPLPPTETMEQIQSKKIKQQEDELSKAIQRAECIVESLDGIKIYPMLGKPSELLNKPKYTHFFDGIFVSSRMAQSVSLDYFTNLPKKNGLVSMETGKFLVPLGKEEKKTMIIKETEIATNKGWEKIDPPVNRRRRDADDKTDDVLFFST